MRRPYLSRLLLAGSLLLASNVAQSQAFETVDTLVWPSEGRFPAYPPEESRPYSVFVGSGFLHDTNILRSDAGAESENVFRFGAGGRVDQRIYGRQALRLEA